MIKHRLVRNGEIVGYESHNYQESEIVIGHLKNNGCIPICIKSYPMEYIPHDHKDKYVCNDIEGNEVYENDYLKGEGGELYKIVWNEEDLRFDCLVHFEKGEFEWDGNIGDNIHPKELFVFKNAHEYKIIANPEKEGYWKMVKNDNPELLEENRHV